MIEGCGDILPIGEVVARLALGTEAALVEVFVAGGASLGDSDECAVKVFDLDQRAFTGRDVLGRVTLLAVNAGMLSFENIARLFMIEGPGIPLDEWEVDAIVIGMALHASLARSRLQAVGKVQPFVSVQARCDLAVAVQAFEDRLAAKLVAGSAAGGAFEVLVGAGQRAG